MPCGDGVDDRHRSRAPHIHGPECPGQAARTQRHPEGRSARRRAACGHEGRNADLGSGRVASRRRIRDPVQPHPHHLTRAARPRSSPASEALPQRSAGASLSSSAYCSRRAAVFDDILKSRHEGSAHSPRISSLLTYLGWLKGHSDWVPPVMLWWLGKGKEPGRARLVPRRARSPGLRPAHSGSSEPSAAPAGSAPWCMRSAMAGT